jgi:geranylgeranyl pyrophosphate synthase
LGKPVGSDLREGTLTLPSLLLLEDDPSPRNPVRRLFSAQRKKEKLLAEAVAAITASDTIARSMAMAREFGNRAMEAITALPDTEAHRTLDDLVEYVLSRSS